MTRTTRALGIDVPISIARPSRLPSSMTLSVRKRRPLILHQRLRHLPLRGRRYSFRANTSLIAAFSKARSAYIRLSFEFSASSSRMRFRSDTLTPAYFDRQV